jgi:protein SCO1/2
MTRSKSTHFLLGAAALLAAVALLATLSSCGGGGGATASQEQGVPSGQSKGESAAYRGIAATPPKQAPELKLDDSLGEPVDLTHFKGKAVLLTFIYTHCPDICPLIVSHLKTAQAELGPKAKDLQILAVSTDPRGDTPQTVTKFLSERGMTGRMDYLIGSRAELGKVWTDWNIVAKPDKAGRDLVEHSALVYGIAANGEVTTLYPANFSPAEIVHDVPLLER